MRLSCRTAAAHAGINHRTAALGDPCGARLMLVRSRPSSQGTTSNGTSLLPFKTGAFLAGVPVQPVIIKYGEVRIGEWGRRQRTGIQ